MNKESQYLRSLPVPLGEALSKDGRAQLSTCGASWAEQTDEWPDVRSWEWALGALKDEASRFPLEDKKVV